MEIREQIKSVIASVEPFDSEEREHQEDVIDWISSGVEIFRVQKDAIPPKHLVSYSVVVDPKEKKILLFHHKAALALLPSGGHIDRDELPVDAAKRELQEELGLGLPLLDLGIKAEQPFFVTVSVTKGISERHTDVSLWYVFVHESTIPLDESKGDFVREFDGYGWFSYQEILDMHEDKLGHNMHRFVQKIMKTNI